jgi:5-methylcytosine-specific restriction endonuclease McrA/ribosomal protein S27E
VVPLTDEIVKSRIIKKFDNIEHVSGHTSNGTLVVRCKDCNNEFNINEQQTRKADHVQCPHCAERAAELKRKAKQDVVDRNKLINRIISLIKKRETALNDLEHKTRLCVVCGNEFIARHGNRLACSEKCERKLKRQCKHTRKAMKKCNGRIDRDISLEGLIKRDRGVCHICGRKCDKRDFVIDANGSYVAGPNHPSIDHLLPLSNGGTDTWDNIKLAHHKCNWVKSNHQYYEKASGQMMLAI